MTTSPRATLIEAMQDAENPADALDRMLVAMTALGLKVVPVELTRDMAWALDLELYDRNCDPLGWSMPYRTCIASAPDLLDENIRLRAALAAREWQDIATTPRDRSN